ncbi:hypothetical protein [Flavobacterium sp. LAR06]|uniref:hypothetical protein n=1 Tax=Flavobacterium sp. LAR06 TaxID=3064897 RepID=UPI0035BF8FE3
MKKNILIGLIILSLSACKKTTEEKMKESIEGFIMEKADDPKSYESVSFKMVVDKSSMYNEDGYLYLLKEYIQAMEIEDRAVALEKQKNILKKTLEYEKKYKPKVDAFTMNHVFRLNNKAGALVLDSANFVFDENLEVIDSKKIEYEM